jgi:flagellar biogenesis protein FliO
MGATLLDAAHSSTAQAAVSLAQAALALAGIALLAWAVRRARHVRALRTTGKIRVSEKLPLDLRNTLWVVELDGRRLLIGTADGAPPRLLRELEPPPSPSSPSRTTPAPAPLSRSAEP